MADTMTAEQIVNVWRSFHSVALTELQHEKLMAAIRLICDGCHAAGYAEGLQKAGDIMEGQVASHASDKSDQQRYDDVSVTGSGRQVDDEAEPPKVIPDEPEPICDGCGVIGGQHRHWCHMFDPLSTCDCTAPCKADCPRWPGYESEA